MQNELGYDQLIHFENHCSASDPMTIPATTAREAWYGIGGYPTIKIDGLITEYVYEGGTCSSTADVYRNRINTRLAQTGGVSPVEITGSFYITGTSSVKMDAKFKLVDPVSLTSLRATLLVYEDNVTWCCGSGGVNLWQHNTRGMYDQSITLTSVGDEVNISTTMALNSAWNPEEMHVVAYLQKTTGNREIIQGAMLTKIYDFTLGYDQYVDSVPQGNGAATFDAALTNIGADVDTLTLQPAAPFGAWVTEFLIGSDPTVYTAPTDVILDPAESVNVKVRVRTDAVKEMRTGSFKVTSGLTLREKTTSLKVYNGSYAVLLVDDDDSFTYEVPLENALNTLGLLFEKWDVVNGHSGLSPATLDMAGYDYLIWQTGWRTAAPLTDNDMDALTNYMDNGGALFLTSQSFANQLAAPLNTFATDYLGIASWTVDKGYVQMDGVAGDPIGNGISLPLTIPYVTWKKGDDVVPGATASTCFLAPDGSHTTIRNTMPGGAKSVFMASSWNAISESDADPNNTKTVLDRILTWMQPQNPADVEEGTGLFLASRITGVRPNPSGPRTEISFALSAAGATGPVRLEIFDIAGRHVTALVDGVLTPGPHAIVWNGLNDAGLPVGSGVYFARLATHEGSQGAKLIVLK